MEENVFDTPVRNVSSVASKTNFGLVRQQAEDRFRENLKFVLLDGATILTMEQLEKAVKEVTASTFQFLSESPKSV